MSEPIPDRLRLDLAPVLSASIAVGVSVAVVLVGIIYFDRLPLLLLAGLLAAGGVAMLRWPDLTTLVAIGLLYSNLAVVAVRFHGAPAPLPAVVLAMFAWPLFYHLCVRREKLFLGSAAPFLFAFGVIQLIGALLARDPKYAFENFVSFVLEGAIVYLVITNLIRTRRMAIASFWVLAACAILMGGMPLVQQLTGQFDSNYGGLAQIDSQFQTDEDAVEGVIRQQRAAGTIGEQNRYAQFMILLVPIGFSLLAMTTSTTLRLSAAAATITALLGFALAFSRGAAVGLVLAFGVAVCLRLINRSQMKLAFIGVALVLLFLPQYLTRLSSLGALIGDGQRNAELGQADGAIRGRLTEMGGALLAFRDHPLFGVGPGMFGKYSQEYGQVIGLRSLEEGRQAHSMPLDIAAENGLLGLLAMTGVFVAVFCLLLRGRSIAITRNDREGQYLTTGMLLAVILYGTTGLFLHLSYIRYFWLLIALADAIGHVVVHDDGNEVGQSPATASALSRDS